MEETNYSGRTDLQLEVRAYFDSNAKGGCLSKKKPISDERFLEILKESINALKLDERIRNYLQVDDLNDDNCITVKNFIVNDKNALSKTTKDGHYVSSICKISKIIFLDEEVIFYDYYLNLLNNVFTETANEYFYKDISELSCTTSSIEKQKSDRKGCFRKSIKISYEVEESQTFSFKTYGEIREYKYDNQSTTQLIISRLRENMRKAKHNA